MAPRLPRAPVGSAKLLRVKNRVRQQTCLICSISPLPSRPQCQRQQSRPLGVRTRSSEASAAAHDPVSHPSAHGARSELRNAVKDLQKHAENYVSLSRLALALKGLEQTPGEETVRIAILGSPDGGTSLRKAKKLLRLLLADPLRPEEEWERALMKEQAEARPMMIRVGQEATRKAGRLLQLEELYVSSPLLNAHKLDILVLQADSLLPGADAENLLMPKMDIPTSSTGRHTYITAPVHKSFVIADGIQGAANLLRFSQKENEDVVASAVDLKTFGEVKQLPFHLIDLDLATAALASFRESLDNAIAYEKDWFASGVPNAVEWIVADTLPTPGEMKLPLRRLISSLLSNANIEIQKEKASRLSIVSSVRVPAQQLDFLRQRIDGWAERAHTELRDQLDMAFAGRRWDKLAWWKLFWRVDDVSMITIDLLNQRFLINAEREVIFLAGRLEEAGVFETENTTQGSNWAYADVEEPESPTRGLQSPQGPRLLDVLDPRFMDSMPATIKQAPWPEQIPTARAVLSTERVPALQALAQRLVLQTLSTSTVTTALGGLMYLSELLPSLYEAGGVAALGVVWSLRRMQNKWEAARIFWEGEVREEGRKAVREAASVMGEVVEGAKSKPVSLDADSAAELNLASSAVKRAEDALAASK